MPLQNLIKPLTEYFPSFAFDNDKSINPSLSLLHGELLRFVQSFCVTSRNKCGKFFDGGLSINLRV